MILYYKTIGGRISLSRLWFGKLDKGVPKEEQEGKKRGKRNFFLLLSFFISYSLVMITLKDRKKKKMIINRILFRHVILMLYNRDDVNKVSF